MGLPNGGPTTTERDNMGNELTSTDPFKLQPIDYVMSALENALHSGLTLEEVIELGNFAQSIGDWDYAISLYTT